MINYTTDSPEKTMEIAQQCARDMGPGTIVYLYGELGSGKTVFVKGLCMGLGVKDIVTSPSFVIVTEYQGRLPVSHIDLYRLDTRAALDLHLEDYIMAHGVTVIEWADRLEKLEASRVKVTITLCDASKREIVIEDTRH